MTEQEPIVSESVNETLQTAIQDLRTFILPDGSRLKVDRNGHLSAEKETSSERIVSLVRSLIAPLFPERIERKKNQELERLKKAILDARKIVCNSTLLERLKTGTPYQCKLASDALSVIELYNATITEKHSTRHNDDQAVLLSDPEIGVKIDLFPGEAERHPAQNAIETLSKSLSINASCDLSGAVHRNTDRFMIDSFKMKALRLIGTRSEISNPADFLRLIRQIPVEKIQDSENPSKIRMRQLLEIQNTSVTITGTFNVNIESNNSEIMSMPMPTLQDLCLTLEEK